ncbi:FAD-dependent monooxygenase [Ciceribacter sp. L1K22]|uniref:FAD-dependent monooxygenase n=1 Tax=Ciceribacter sp. L1K22 TaxID=2820275 RepID=UPI001ABE51CF|nr:FAD-dependent monooxygenase [Ciceribacter sp. L1K22]MBO3760145.1 FAD-dependent monooxygenase [Ciceribacter sp. L1K22]
MSIQNVAIVGAGVAGLTAALSLARLGIHCDILEQAPQLTEVGAGLQLSPNASRILGDLGVLDDLERKWCEPDTLRLADGRSLKAITALPAGRFARERWGAPYGVLHRATLQQGLLHAVLHNRNCRLHLGSRLTSTDPASIEALTGVKADLFVGADGVWSTLRERVPNSPGVTFSGNVAWRFTLKDTGRTDILDPSNLTAYLGRDSHMVCYPLKEIDGFNIVAITAGASPGETWAAQGSAAQRAVIMERFSGWNRKITALLLEAGEPTFWPLYQASAGSWQNGRDTVLIGDAAHAMMPFAAQGAAMAIEDGFELAGAVSRQPLPQALSSFETGRKRRAAKVKDRADFNRMAYHASGPMRVARDLVLSLRSPKALISDLDWLYGYRAKG